LNPSADALNHLLRQNSWAGWKLRPLCGKVIRLALPPFRTTLMIDGAGEFSAVTPDTAHDAEISLSPGAALRLLLQPGAAPGLVTLQGDMEVAATVGQVLQGLRWDFEEDLSRITGDIPAHQIARTGSRIRQEAERQAASVAGMLAEYWLEESPLIAKRVHLERFSRAVDTLRDDAERLAKRLEILEQKR
jgi:ubiquinone biosynthesis accessory factor UbiJ